ncbi:MAG: ABC transporter ATP-binding protein [Gemmatimonadota bacterium]
MSRPAGVDAEGPVVAEPFFDARRISVRYRPKGPRALDEVDLTVPRRSLCAVLGPNGSGKSTLMRALLGTVALEEGEAHVDGRLIERWRRRELAKCVGAVTQSESTAFPITVRELVEMGRYPHVGPLNALGPDDNRAVQNALARCDAVNLSDRSVATLSGGEFQRVRIARALAQEPAALVLDEPTASLDIRHEMAILELLRRSVDGGMTVLLVTHHLDLAARFADRVLLLDRGRVAAEGPPADVLTVETLEGVYQWPLAVASHPVTGALSVTPLPGRPPAGR